ncbi:hypothetical protein MSSAC_1186 [Methanosarcina siciliae C2J]|uniref:Uncharacterized protein n=1 Tax=Methanosarcina siciliae C2J TaxID=1434118 RepID=A0A0E3LCM4_9EURY|nr:hypothetical protein MSSAC_1186 [Methanosarcina siciliae C2J]
MLILLFTADKMYESCKQENFVQIEDLIANKVNCSDSDENPPILLYFKLECLITNYKLLSQIRENDYDIEARIPP